MHPTLTLSGHGGVPSYELALALGACALVTAVAGSASIADLPRARLFAWLSGTYLAAIVAARLAFAASHWPDADAALRSLVRLDAVGFASFGAIALGGLAGRWLAARLGLPFARLAGPLLVGGCLFGAFARLGCFLAGCCHGLPTTLPWGVTYPQGTPAELAFGPGVAVHPYPLYEAALLTAIAMVAARGAGILAPLVAYLVGRLVLETTRGDVSRWEGFSASQWMALVALVAIALASTCFSRAPRTVLRGVSSE